MISCTIRHLPNAMIGFSYTTDPGQSCLGALSFGTQRLSTEPIGAFLLILSNVVIDSIYQIEVASTGAVVTSGTAASSTINLNIPLYAAGSALNSLRIKVRKATTAPYYQPYETQTTSFLGSTSLFVNQVRDDA